VVAALPAGWAATAHPFVRRTPAAVPGPEWTGCSAAIPGRTDDDRDQTKHATIARLGRIGTSTWRDRRGPRPYAVAARAAPCVGRPARGRRRGRAAPPPLVRPARTAAGPGAVGSATCPCPCLCLCWACPSRPPGPFELCYRACRVGLAARRAGCQRNRCHPANQPPGLGGGWSVDSRPAPPHARAPARHRRAGLGVLCDQAEGGPDEGPHQRARDNQMLAATAK
jgi:hypothetical protein